MRRAAGDLLSQNPLENLGAHPPLKSYGNSNVGIIMVKSGLSALPSKVEVENEYVPQRHKSELVCVRMRTFRHLLAS